MTTKLVLTIDATVLSIAKKYAKQQGKSLSYIVENYLMCLKPKESKEEIISSRILKLRGVAKLKPNFNYKNALGKSLVKKTNS